MRALLLAPLLVLVSACATTADKEIASLHRQLGERDAEIAALRARVAQRDQLKQVADQNAAHGNSGFAVGTRDVAMPAPAATEDEQETRALEQALVRRGTQVLPKGQVLIEPEVSYAYSGRGGLRRDTFRGALTARVGLPAAMQADVRVPVVIRDRLERNGSTSGLSDVVLGLSKELLAQKRGMPALVLSGRWYADTGRHSRPFFTGLGADAWQLQLTASATNDPLVLFGSLSYAWIGEHGSVDYGNAIGASFGSYVAATPGTSLYFVVSGNSNAHHRIAKQRVAGSSQLSGLAEFGATTALRRNTFLNISAGAGIGHNAPDLVLTVSLPVRF